MKEYLNKIIQGDCLEVMRGMPDKCVDLVVTSPPYDNLRDYKGYTFDFEGIAQQLTRVLKDGGVIVWVVADATVNGSETGTSFRQALYFKDVCGLNLHDTMIYGKIGCTTPQCVVVRYDQAFEYMFVFSKGVPKTMNIKCGDGTGRVIKKTQRKANRENEFYTGFYNEGTAPEPNIFVYKNGASTYSERYVKKHPAVFPEKLAKDHILSWSNPGDIVLDCFSGSGTTAKMAKLTNRQFIGIELSPEYCEIARKRLDKTYYNEEMF